MAINENSGLFSWTPGATYIGNHNVTISVTDGEDSDMESFSITVIDVIENTAPTFSILNNQFVITNQALSFQISATDADEDDIAYSLDGISLSKGMSINASNGDFTWTTSVDDLGIHMVIVTATDGELSSQGTFDILVSETENNAPVISLSLDRYNVTSLDTLEFEVDASDADPGFENLLYSLDEVSLAKGMYINSITGKFRWVPDTNYVGDHVVRVSVSDGFLASTEELEVTVLEAGADANVITNIDAFSIENNVHIYPNPTKDVLFIAGINQMSDYLRIRIVNLLGETVESFQISSAVRDQASLVALVHIQNGTYFLIAENDNELLVRRFIKQ